MPAVRSLPGALSMLAPLHLGPVVVEFPAVQAALSGYTDGPMRQIARRLGAPYTLCEVLLDQFVVNVTKGPKAQAVPPPRRRRPPLRRATDGRRPGAVRPGGRRNSSPVGFDVIDLNFACPVKKVLGRCRGGYLLSQPAAALEIVARVRDALPPRIPLTVKLRRGMDDTAESRDRFFAIFDGAFARGAVAATVHGRTVRQRYEGAGLVGVPPRGEATCRPTDRAGQRRPVHRPRLPRHAGPDRRGRREHRPRGDRQPVDFRAGPRLGGRPGRRAAESAAEQRAVIAEHYRLAEELYGPKFTPSRMRKFGIKYARLHPQAEQVRDAFVAVGSAEDFYAVLEKWYAEDV